MVSVARKLKETKGTKGKKVHVGEGIQRGREENKFCIIYLLPN